MALKNTLVINYLSQGYVTLIGILIVPAYLRSMGPEAYGLIGFFSLLMTVFAMLDVGLSLTISREAARFRGLATNLQKFSELSLIIEVIFWCLGLLIACTVFFLSDYLSMQWLNIKNLQPETVFHSLNCMSVILLFRFVSGYYRGQIIGFEKLCWLASFNAGIATLRFVIVLPLLLYYSASPVVFFSYQVFVAFVELVLLVKKSKGLFAHASLRSIVFADLNQVFSNLKFTASIGFTSIVWVLVTQVDKVVLSKMISLSEYGYFSASILVASGVLLLSTPLSTVIMPRLANLEAKKDLIQFEELYKTSTQFMVLVAGSVSLTLGFNAQEVLEIWTGDHDLVAFGAPVLMLYALGNGLLVLAAFPYYLQYAKGNMRLHILGNLIFLFLIIPAQISAVLHFGAVGAGLVWLAANFIFLTFWSPIVHNRFLKNFNKNWFVHDILFILIPKLIFCYIWYLASNNEFITFPPLFSILVMGCCLLCIGSVSSKACRSIFFEILKAKK